MGVRVFVIQLLLVPRILRVEVRPVGSPVGAVAEGAYVGYFVEALQQGVGEGGGGEQRTACHRAVTRHVESSRCRGRVYVAGLCEEELS